MFCLHFTKNGSGFHSSRFDRSASLWKKILENYDISLLGFYLWLDKLTRKSGTILDKSHQDINGRKLRKLGKSQEWDESVLHLVHAQPNPEHQTGKVQKIQALPHWYFTTKWYKYTAKQNFSFFFFFFFFFLQWTLIILAPCFTYVSSSKWAASWKNQQNACVPSKDSDQHGHPLVFL